MHAVSIARTCLAVVLAAPGAAVMAQTPSTAEVHTVNGSVAYRQRIAMPPEAVLTVRIEDVSRADAPAKVLAETREAFGTRQVPIPFVLTVPRSAIDARARYALRASVSVGNELRFTTDRHHPLTMRGGTEKFDLLLVAVSAAPVTAPPTPKLSFGLPASFAGVLPCADCPGVAHTLTLRADGLYRLRRTYLGKPGEPVVEVGRWRVAAGGKQITLGRGDAAQPFAVVDGETLSQLDRQGQPIKTAANLDLRRTAQVDAITETLPWRGELRYMADAASFTDCASGLRWPVANGGDYLSAERRYGQARSAPGAPLLVSFDGRLEHRPGMEASPREHMVIERFGDAQPGAGCGVPAAAPGSAMASLKDTYWKLVELDGKPILMAPKPQREVRITLASSGARVSGFAGCNKLTGGYEQSGSTLRFTQLAGTMMACAAPLMELETGVHKMLRATTAYRIEGQHLSLLAGDKALARFEAVYLR